MRLSHNVKCIKFVLSFSVSIMCLQLYGQDRSAFEIYFSPVGLRVGHSHIEEYGLGIYKFKNSSKLNFELGVLYSYRVVNNLHFNLGVGIKKINYDFNFYITNPFDTDELLTIENRFHNRLMLSPHIGCTYLKGKFSLSIGYEPNFEVFSKSNIRTNFGPTELFIDPVSQKSAYFTITERDWFTDDIIRFGTPVVSIQYQLNPKFSVRLSGLIKPYGKLPLYQLDIQGKTAEMADGNYILNDTRVNNKMMFVYFGMSYLLSKNLATD